MVSTSAELLADAAARPAGAEIALSIRNLIAHWGARRRGYWYVEAIRAELEAAGLTTVPSFEVGWIDNTVVLKRLASQLLPAAPDGQGSAKGPSDATALGRPCGFPVWPPLPALWFPCALRSSWRTSSP